jgi:hypothetical protein
MALLQERLNLLVSGGCVRRKRESLKDVKFAVGAGGALFAIHNHEVFGTGDKTEGHGGRLRRTGIDLNRLF